jgi:fumarate reductase subunit C
VKPYIAIIREFWRVSFLVPVVSFIVVAIPLGIFGLQAYFLNKLDANVSAFRATFIYPVIGCVAGFVLSLLIVQMNKPHLRITLPRYERKLMTATVIIALGVLAFFALSIVAISYGRDGFADAMRYVPLTTYGAMGIGYLLTVFAPVPYNGQRRTSRASIAIFIAVVMVLALLVVSANNEHVREFLKFEFVPWLRIVDVVSLAIGPLAWPWYVKFIPHEKLLATASREVNSRRMLGEDWFLGDLAKATGTRFKAEYLSLHPALLNYSPIGVLTSSIMVLLVLLLFNVSDSSAAGPGGIPKDLDPFWWFPMTVLALLPVRNNAVTSAALSRVLLLPGLPSRATFPRWIAGRFLGFWIVGAGIVLSPILVAALWMGITAKTLVLAILLTMLGISTFAMLMFWMHPKRDKPFVKNGFLLWIVHFSYLMLSLGFNPVEVAAEYSLASCVFILALAFALPYVLYRMGLRGWRSMRYVG